MSRQGNLVTICDDRRPFSCHVCGGILFVDREVKVNTSAAELFDFGWANASGTGLVCQTCGYLHTFLSGVQLWVPEDGYPTADDDY